MERRLVFSEHNHAFLLKREVNSYKLILNELKWSGSLSLKHTYSLYNEVPAVVNSNYYSQTTEIFFM